MKKRINILCVLLAICLCLSAFAGCGSTEKTAAPAAPAAPEAEAPAAEAPAAEGESAKTIAPVTIKLGHCDAEDVNDSNHNYATAFKDYCAELSGGAITIEIYGNQQLGGELDMMEQIQLGTLDMMNMTNVNIASFFSGTMLFDLPYFFKDADAAFYLIDSELGQKVLANFEAASGIKTLSTGYAGFRQTYNNVRPISEPEDVKGMKLRVPGSNLYIAAFESLGANPAPLAWTETFTAVQQGVMDGLECPLTVCYNSGIYDFTKYASLTNHTFSCLQQVISVELWNSLDADQQAIIQEASRKAATDQRAFIRGNEAKYVEMLKEKGMEVTEINYEAFRELASTCWGDFSKEIGADILEEAIALMEDYTG